MKSIEFARCQVHLDPSTFDASSDGIEHDGPVCERHLCRSFRCAKSTNRSTDSRCQLARLKWLGDVVVSASFQCLDLVIFTVADCQHKNRDFRIDAPDA